MEGPKRKGLGVSLGGRRSAEGQCGWRQGMELPLLYVCI